MTHRVTLIPGDGIGPEVVEAARRVVEATGVEVRWDVEEIGLRAFERTGEVLPARAVSSIRENGVGLKGPIETPEGAGIRSAN
ncbi:MAG: isocitrate/isopropylmalate dehydrogenase family protein, partial [Actinobacteria bacterium]|nr:isocitrate/isopropylmalate dehydrogenase family protein [Actinomycetota bacterium]